MNYTLTFKLIGNMLGVQAAFMLAPLIVSFMYGGSDRVAFLWSVLILAVLGTSLSQLKPKDKKFSSKNAFAAAALSWLLFSLFGALPFYFSGCFAGFADCVFESVSGFTTTGATVLSELESLPRGIVFWRSLSHWIGGMGVVLFMLALMPTMNASSINLLRAEGTGLSPNRVVPKVRETARVMYAIYLMMTFVVIILLLMSGLPLYDALVHGFSTAGTGGLSSMSASVGAYNNVAAEIIITIFMFLFSISFTLYFYLYKRDFKQILKDEEFRLYLGLFAAATAIITINVLGVYSSAAEAFRHASFQVSAVISTTGFSTADYNLWPTLSRVILTLLMLTGGCAGSTGGGIKLIRFLVLFKAVRIEIGKIIHPRSVKPVTINGRKVDDSAVMQVAVFMFIYLLIFFVSAIIISAEGKDLVSSVSAAIAMLSNIGPGFGIVGPAGNYSSFTSLSKFILSFCMLAGRLEFFPILILFTPSVWRRKAL